MLYIHTVFLICPSVSAKNRLDLLLRKMCIRDRHRIVRDEGVVHVVVKSGPLGNGGVQILSLIHILRQR